MQAPMPPDDAQQQDPQNAQPPGGQGPLTDMIVQTDQALTAIANVLAKASPEAAQAMTQVNEQFRQIIQAVMNQGQADQGPQAASPMVSPETQGKPAMQAY